MSQFTLVIGNKNYSSWSMRPWLVLKHFNIPFKEMYIPLYQDGTKEALWKWSPSGLVPALRSGDFAVWDSLAICEYLQELFPEHAMWPQDANARAVARSISAEMHSGFAALRRSMPMNCRLTFPGKGMNDESAADIERITNLWRECRETYGTGGQMLFGEFTIADAMFAPIALRLRTYAVQLDEVCEAYVTALLSLPEVEEWIADAQAEEEVIEAFEPYRNME
jgi:glutathione S-transferase